MRVVFWGTYDLGKSRTRIILRGLRASGAEIVEIHSDPWQGIPDKSQLSFRRLVGALARACWAYPCLLVRYLRCPAHDVVVVAYLGLLDVLLIWPWARMRRVPIVWDAFLSLHDTIVGDRGLLRGGNPLAITIPARREAGLPRCEPGGRGYPSTRRFLRDSLRSGRLESGRHMGRHRARALSTACRQRGHGCCRSRSGPLLWPADSAPWPAHDLGGGRLDCRRAHPVDPGGTRAGGGGLASLPAPSTTCRRSSGSSGSPTRSSEP